MSLLAIAALAGITYAFRIAGPLLRDRVTVPPVAERMLGSAAAVLLVALAATSALTQDGGFAGWARPAGVLAAAVLAARRAPFPVVVLAAALVTALLRLGGIHLSRTNRGACGPQPLARTSLVTTGPSVAAWYTPRALGIRRDHFPARFVPVWGPQRVPSARRRPPADAEAVVRRRTIDGC
jgi:branched-subunit amino acid transport protein